MEPGIFSNLSILRESPAIVGTGRSQQLGNMKNNIYRLLIIIFFLFYFYGCTNNLDNNDRSIISRNYCTEIGRFDMLFYGDEISGSYALLPKRSLGAIWGKLKKLEMKGRWIDEDGKGDIIITFNQDFTFFTTSYRNDEHPEKWYEDSWHGHLRSNQNQKFSINGKEY